MTSSVFEEPSVKPACYTPVVWEPTKQWLENLSHLSTLPSFPFSPPLSLFFLSADISLGLPVYHGQLAQPTEFCRCAVPVCGHYETAQSQLPEREKDSLLFPYSIFGGATQQLVVPGMEPFTYNPTIQEVGGGQWAHVDTHLSCKPSLPTD